MDMFTSYRSLGYERVYLPLCQIADTPFHIQGDDIMIILKIHNKITDFFMILAWV